MTHGTDLRRSPPVMSTGRLAHTPPLLGHPTGPVILPFLASCSTDWSIPDLVHGGLPQAGVGEGLDDEAWLVVCHHCTALDVVVAGCLPSLHWFEIQSWN